MVLQNMSKWSSIDLLSGNHSVTNQNKLIYYFKAALPPPHSFSRSEEFCVEYLITRSHVNPYFFLFLSDFVLF